MFDTIKDFFTSNEEKKNAIQNKISFIYKNFKNSFISEIDYYFNDTRNDKLKNLIEELEKQIENNLSRDEKRYKKEFYSYYLNIINSFKEDLIKSITIEDYSRKNKEMNSKFAQLMNRLSYKDNEFVDLERQIAELKSNQEKELRKKEEEHKKQLEEKERERNKYKNVSEMQQKNLKEIQKLKEEYIKQINDIKNKNKKELEKQNKIITDLKKTKENFEKKQKEHEQTIENIKNDYNKQIETLKSDARCYERLAFRKKRSEERETQNLQNEIEKLKKQYEEEKEQEKKERLKEEQIQLEEKKKKIEAVNKSFNEEFEKIKKAKIEEIRNNFKENEENYGIEEISKFDKEKIRNLILDLFEKEKIADKILLKLSIFTDKSTEKMKNIEHLNIVLVGPSGVGKSTLINAILEPNSENEAKTGFGLPQTTDIKYYSSEKISFIRLADSQGIEKDVKAGVKTISESIKNFINSQFETKDYDKFIHLIWYCFTGTRLEKSEVEVLKELGEQYTLQNLPIIIVYTNAIDQSNIKKAEEFISKTLKLNNDFIAVLAKDKEIIDGSMIRSYNLDKLMNLSIEKAKSAVHSSCYEGLINQIKSEVINMINNLSIDLKEKIKIKIQKILSDINEKTKIDYIYQELTNIIIDLFYKYIFLSSDIKLEYTKGTKTPEVTIGEDKFCISLKSQSDIKDFAIEYYKQIYNIYSKNLEDILTTNSTELSNKIIAFQLDFNKKNDNLLKTSWDSSQLQTILKSNIHDEFSQNIKIALFKNAFNYIITPFIEQLNSYFIDSYKFAMKEPEFVNKATEAAKISFDKIVDKINEYNENIKNKKEEDIPKEITTTEIPKDIKNQDKKEVRKNDISNLFNKRKKMQDN